MMKRITSFFTLLLLCTLSVFAANDSDLDGVEDINDKCPNTPFSDLIDSSGCTTSSLYTSTLYDVIVGYDYASSNTNTLEDTATYTTTFQADMYHGNFSAQIQSSYYQSDGSSYNDSGWNDTQLSLFYLFKPTNDLMIQTGAGIILPTYSTGYDNEATDYIGTVALSYALNPNINLFGGYSYTAVNDDDIPDLVDYQNTNAFYGGIGYINAKNRSINFSYTHTQSIYAGVDPIETLSAKVLFPLDTHWFMIGDYRYGLSDTASDHEAAVRIGYAF